MSDFVVHTIPGSPYARAVMATLEEKRVPWRLSPLAPGQAKQEPYLKLHRFGRMPAIEHDGFALYETQAILRYIDRVWPDPAMTPADAKLAARMDQVMNINDWYLFQGCANVIAFQRVIGPKLLGLVPDEAAIAAAMPRAELVFAELARLLGDQSFFAGEAISLADMLLGPQMDFMSWTPEWHGLTAKRPNLVAWLARLNERPSFKVTTWDNVARKAAA